MLGDWIEGDAGVGDTTRDARTIISDDERSAAAVASSVERLSSLPPPEASSVTTRQSPAARGTALAQSSPPRSLLPVRRTLPRLADEITTTPTAAPGFDGSVVPPANAARVCCRHATATSAPMTSCHGDYDIGWLLIAFR